MPPLFSTAYLPSVLYLACLSRYDTVAIELYETFPKQTFRNRTLIATGNGLQTLSVPAVRTFGNHTRTDQMGISYTEPWHIRHWRAILSAYNAAPYFLYYRDGLEKILLHPYDSLVDLNDSLLQYLLAKFKITCRVEHTTDFVTPAPELPDYRNALTCKHPALPVDMPPYSQVFDTRFGFQPNLSAIDLLFNLGPEARDYLRQLAAQL